MRLRQRAARRQCRAHRRDAQLDARARQYQAAAVSAAANCGCDGSARRHNERNETSTRTHEAIFDVCALSGRRGNERSERRRRALAQPKKADCEVRRPTHTCNRSFLTPGCRPLAVAAAAFSRHASIIQATTLHATAAAVCGRLPVYRYRERMHKLPSPSLSLCVAGPATTPSIMAPNQASGGIFSTRARADD